MYISRIKTSDGSIHSIRPSLAALQTINITPDSWRGIKINDSLLLGTGINTGAVNFKNGNNITITGSGNDISIGTTNNISVAGTLTVNGDTLLGDASTDNIKLNGATYVYNVGGYTGATILNVSTLQEVLGNKADKAATLAGYGITDAYTKAQIDSKLASVYKAVGSAASVAELGTLIADHEGWVYNMSAAFTTTSDFIEGAGKTYPVGTNVAIVLNNSQYKYDVLAGFVDLTDYAKTADVVTDISTNGNTLTWKKGTVSQTPITVPYAVNSDTVDNKHAVDLENLVEVTWSSLKSARDGSTLIPGKFYRITDYTCTTVQENTQSAGHVFDIIVRADASNKLNENAFAIQHSGDTYFANSKLDAWELKYSLDNDTDRFAWADSTNGKGVIYYMKDEWNNECPYDFKNIQFKRWAITAYTKVPSLVVDNANNTYGLYYGAKNILNNSNIIADATYGNNSAFFYTFALKEVSSGNFYDYSVENSRFLKKSDEMACCYGNKISQNSIYDTSPEYTKNIKSILNNGVFYGICTNLSYGSSTDQSTLTSIYYNRINSINSNFTIGAGASNNEFYMFNDNTIGNNVNSNRFNGYCSGNTIGNECNYNSAETSFWGNTAGDTFRGNNIGSFVYLNNFGNNFRLNDLSGGSVDYCEFINETMGCTFGRGCQYIKFLKENMWYNVIGANNSKLTITSNQTTSWGVPLSNIIVVPRTNCSDSQEKIISHDIPPVTYTQNAPLYTYQPVNSKVISV